MPTNEAKIFINSKCDTGQLRDASNELLYQDLRIVDTFTDRIQTTNPGLSTLPTPHLIRLRLGPQQLPDKTKKRWEAAEMWVTKLLVTARLMDYPHHAQLRATEMLDSARVLGNMQEAEGFVSITHARLGYLLSEQGQQGLDTIRLAIVAFVENTVLKKAVYEGVYFHRAQPIEPLIPN